MLARILGEEQRATQSFERATDVRANTDQSKTRDFEPSMKTTQ